MKDLYKKNLENINISEIQKFALDLGLSIYTEHTEKDKPKSTLISDLLDYIFAKNLEDKFYDFCSNGIMLFYPLAIKKNRKLFNEDTNREENIKKIFKIEVIPHGTIYYPIQPIDLFSDISIFMPKDSDFLIFFKKYANNKLAVLRHRRKIENLFGFELNNYFDDFIHFKMLENLKLSNLRYEKKLNENSFIIAKYVSHQFRNVNIKISSRLNYLRAATKEVFDGESGTSEAINKLLEQITLPIEIDYAVNIPNSSQTTIESCGINLFINSKVKTTRYAINLKRKECKIVQTDTTIEDLMNVSKALSQLNKSFKI